MLLRWHGMSLPIELDQLEEERSKLEDESWSLKEQQKKLEERTKALEQKLTEELRSKNDETRQNISQLESRISDLEQRLAQITQETRTTEPKGETVTQTSNLEVTENVTAEINPEVLERSSEESVALVSPNDSSPTYEEDDSESHQGNKKNKHKFWETHGY